MDDETRLAVHSEREPSIDRRLAFLARRQHGVVSAVQLHWLGLGEEAIRYRIKVGRLHRIHRGVYAVGHRGLAREGDWSAAILACGPGAVLSYRSAGQLHGILTDYGGPIEVSVPRGRAAHREGIRVRTVALSAHAVRHRSNIAVTSLARTLLDLAAVLEPGPLTRALQNARRQGLTIAQLDRQLTRHRRRPGTPRLRAVLERQRNQEGITRGGFEDAVYAWLDDWLPPGFERPVVNQRTGGGRFESDLTFRHHNAILELEFFDHHGGDRAQRTRDTKRDRSLTIEGWRHITITSDEFEDDPDGIEADLRALLGIP